jgi:hypothetical protein
MASEIVRTIASIALYHTFNDAEIDGLLRAFSIPRLRAQMAGLGLCENDADDREVARLYFSGRCRMISPNAYFDEAWYVGHYADVAKALKTDGLISGFVHFVQIGIRRGYWPNQMLFTSALACAVPGVPKSVIDEETYLNLYPAAVGFLAAFPLLTPTEHYNMCGRFLNFTLDNTPSVAGNALSLKVAESEFDPEYYAATYLSGAEHEPYRVNPFQHYVTIGMKAAYSPNSWFQEDWYRAFYKEVRDAIESGWLPSGFYHYILTGRIEGRLPRYDLASALEVKMPGVTNPALIGRTEMLAQRLSGLKILPKRATTRRLPQTIWVFLPTLNPDIMYGGYRAAIALICALHRDGRNVVLVCVEQDPNPQYFLWSETSLAVLKAFTNIPILNMEQFSGVTVGRSDIFVAYSVWDLVICQQLAGLTDFPEPILLAQEYEPIFYDNGAQRALCEACYKIPHYPIINSHFLKEYFRKNRIGIFAELVKPVLDRDYSVFEHKINALPLQSAGAMRARSHRVVAIYARPEAHAARNLFEIVVIALQTLCKKGAFGPEWRFIGLGCLSKLPPLALGGGHELRLTQKMSEDDYKTVMSELDIGISLMFAPHPSVVPFEFATTGALVVTNTYENRSAEALVDICANIVPCEISIEGVIGAIERAMSLVDGYERRERQTLRPRSLSWDAIFSTEIVTTLLSAIDGKRMPTEGSVIDIGTKAPHAATIIDSARRRPRIASPAAV